MSQPYVLVVDDEPDIRDLVGEILADEGYEVAVAENAEAAQQARRARRPDLILLDIWMPDLDGISLLKEWAASENNDAPVIMMSGHGTVETAVEATRLGAYDFLEKPLSIAKLLLTVKHALETAQLRHENVGLKREAISVSEPIGRGANMQALREQAKRIAQHETPVLITGESGTGKDVFAKYMHDQSNRRAGAFVRVAGSGMVGPDAVAELFGAEEGSSIHFGAIERANGGTLYLDDVTDLDLAMQGRLLGAFRHRSFVRTGGLESVEVNTRIMAATAKDLPRLIEASKFREDLYYHLNVVPLNVPPLREHREDIPDLLEFYADMMVKQENLGYRRFTVAGQNRLRNHSWPGNIRELKNVVQRLFILGSGAEIDLQEIEIALGAVPRTEAAGVLPDFSLPLKEARERFERAYLEHQIKLNGGSVSKVAKSAGMERTHLYRKLRALGIDSKQVAGGE